MAGLVAAFIVALGALGLWLSKRSQRHRPPPDLRRADDAQRQEPFDSNQAREEAEAIYWRSRPLP
jgi:hypothetical protein